MAPSVEARESSSRRLAQFQALLQLESGELRRELDRLRQADAAAAAELDALLAHQVWAADDGLLVEDPLPPAHLLPPGTWVGPYEILKVLGHGGMGTVYLARRHEPYRQDVALKRMRPGLSRRLVTRFHAERQILATLHHPGIVQLLDGGDDGDGAPYLVMDYVAGSCLDAYCRDHAPGLDERVRLVHAVAEAVAYAHGQGIVHRDLKPSNVLVGDDGRPRVTDFGLAKVVGAAGSTGATETGILLGTPPYMAPERLSLGPGRDEPGVDVYALGVMLFSLAADRLPIPSGAAIDVCAAALQEDAPPLRRIAPGIPRDLETIVARALARDPRERFADAGALAEQLRRYLAREPLTIRPPTLADRLARWTARHRRALLAWGASFALMLLAMLSTLAVWNRGLQRDRDALRATIRSFWLASATLAEKVPLSDPAIRPFFEDLARSSEEALDRGLLAIDPGLDRQVAVMRRHLAASLEGTDQPLEALSHLDRSVALLRPLPSQMANPTTRAWTEFDLFRSLARRGLILQVLDRLDAALADSDEALAVIRGLVTRHPSYPAWREAQARHLLDRTTLLDQLGRHEEARGANREALNLAQEAVDLAPDNGVNLNTLLVAQTQYADHTLDTAEQERQLRAGCELAGRLARLPGGGDRYNRSTRVYALSRLGRFLIDQGRPAEAVALYAEARAIVDIQLARWPHDLEFMDYRRNLTQVLGRCRELIGK